jgi:hypothetical protein
MMPLVSSGVGWFGRNKDKGENKAPTTAFVHSKNMHLKVAAPQGEGWQLMEAGGGGALLAAIKCLHGEPPDALAFDAMLYAPPADQMPTLEQLRERDWRQVFSDKMFAEIDSLETREVEHRARAGGFVDTGWEIEAEGTLREPAMAMRLCERHVVVGPRLLVVSAAGSPEAFERQQTLVETWLSHAALGER